MTEKKLDRIENGTVFGGCFLIGALIGIITGVQKWVGEQRTILNLTRVNEAIKSFNQKITENL